MAGPVLPDIKTLIQAGINPKNGLPLRFGGDPAQLKSDTKRFLRLIDEQDAVNRYVWYNLPCDITSQELERLLYYKGQVCLFYEKTTEKFYFMPYALDGTIDFYGRYNSVHPVPFSSGGEEDGKKDKLAAFLAEIKLKCIYGMVMPEDHEKMDLESCTVLLHDYSKQLAQTIIPRVTVNDAILETMSECVPFLRTSLIAGSGIKGIRVSDADQADCVKDASKGVLNAALKGEPWVAMIGPVEFQELTDGATLKSEEFMLAMQSLDNLRLSGYGIDNGGLFEKKAHELQSEADINGGPVGLVLQDGLSIRQNFCNIVNSIWDLGIWCEPAQNIMGMDLDGDGAIYDDDADGANTGVEAQENGGEENE